MTHLKTFHAVYFNDFERYNTQQIRDNFLLSELEKDNEICLAYTHYDRMIAGLAKPINTALSLTSYINLKSNYFLERRELGIINVGTGTGKIVADNVEYILEKHDCLYLGKGIQNITFESIKADDNALFFLCSTPAHNTYPTRLMKAAEATILQLGATATANERELCKYIFDDGIASCQLVMGITKIKHGSVWNSVPPHTHDRRSEIYFYFDMQPSNVVFHVMGQPQQTRHMVVKNNEAIVSPSWSMHFGCGSSNYSFIWAMAGENKEFTDMDAAPIETLL